MLRYGSVCMHESVRVFVRCVFVRCVFVRCVFVRHVRYLYDMYDLASGVSFYGEGVIPCVSPLLLENSRPHQVPHQEKQ